MNWGAWVMEHKGIGFQFPPLFATERLPVERKMEEHCKQKVAQMTKQGNHVSTGKQQVATWQLVLLPFMCGNSHRE
ncbi:hypothetical protein Cni_G11424 [Canna indica]|uniref:Uncharacterized protein n=1 Tax=Canna indica TaxID=4628 RepID=A0AAQ3K826_9LILI|nr:hypothetical protein Cni_G11424 [Canna indica]